MSIAPPPSKIVVILKTLPSSWMIVSLVFVSSSYLPVAVTGERLGFGETNCTAQRFLDNSIFFQMEEDDAAGRGIPTVSATCPPVICEPEPNSTCEPSASLCTPDDNKNEKRSYHILDSTEWTIPLQNRYMEILLNRSDFCDINRLLHCVEMIDVVGDVQWKCACREYSAKVPDEQEENAKFCVAQVGYPCVFKLTRHPPPQDLSGKEYTCGPNAECVPIAELNGSRSSISERLTFVAGYPSNEGKWAPPLFLYVERHIASVCVCVEGHAADGAGNCIPIDTALTKRSSGRSVFPDRVAMSFLVVVLFQ